jgi:hypothetical protein
MCAGILATAGVAGTKYYLKDGGGLTTTIPGSGKRIVMVGFAVNTNDLFVLIHDFGQKA